MRSTFPVPRCVEPVLAKSDGRTRIHLGVLPCEPATIENAINTDRRREAHTRSDASCMCLSAVDTLWHPWIKCRLRGLRWRCACAYFVECQTRLSCSFQFESVCARFAHVRARLRQGAREEEKK